MILKSVTQKSLGGCDLCGEPAKWQVTFDLAGTGNLCTGCYRSLTSWTCDRGRDAAWRVKGKDSCGHVNYGLATSCAGCGWVRPKECARCGEVAKEGLVKIMAVREGHDCHACNGGGKVKELGVCGTCVGQGTIGSEFCPLCEGRGGTWVNGQEVKCESCEGAGDRRKACPFCKGLGATPTKASVVCSSCMGSGRCSSLSGQRGCPPTRLERVALTDLPEQVREDLKDYVGMYLCFRCATPEMTFHPYIGVDDRECKECGERLAHNNSDLEYCFKHQDNRHCPVCKERLLLDEPGPFCREHTRCVRCGDPVVEDGLYCEAHNNEKGFGRAMGVGKAEENPVKLLAGGERVHRALLVCARRGKLALERAQRLIKKADEIRENRARADRHTLEGEVQLKLIDKELDRLDEKIEVAQHIAARYSHMNMALLDLRTRLIELRRYDLWDPRSTPVYEGWPEFVDCRSCSWRYNIRRTHLCPRCKFNNRQAPREELTITCEVCGQIAHTLHREARPFEVPKEDGKTKRIVKVTFSCERCAMRPWELTQRREGVLEEIEAVAFVKAQASRFASKVIQVVKQVFERKPAQRPTLTSEEERELALENRVQHMLEKAKEEQAERTAAMIEAAPRHKPFELVGQIVSNHGLIPVGGSVPITPKNTDDMSMAVTNLKFGLKSQEELDEIKRKEDAWYDAQERQITADKHNDFWIFVGSWLKHERVERKYKLPFKELFLKASAAWCERMKEMRGRKSAQSSK